MQMQCRGQYCIRDYLFSLHGLSRFKGIFVLLFALTIMDRNLGQNEMEQPAYFHTLDLGGRGGGQGGS